jgi:mRNA interferase RelE/StbE
MARGAYRLEVTHTAQKDLRQLGQNERRRVLATILPLVDNPRPQGCTKMTDREEYRLSAGSLRITCAIDDKARVVTIYRATHRKDVYR